MGVVHAIFVDSHDALKIIYIYICWWHFFCDGILWRGYGWGWYVVDNSKPACIYIIYFPKIQNQIFRYQSHSRTNLQHRHCKLERKISTKWFLENISAWPFWPQRAYYILLQHVFCGYVEGWKCVTTKWWCIETMFLNMHCKEVFAHGCPTIV